MPETIAAIATPPGVASVGIIRVSGPSAAAICEKLIGRVPAPRVATFAGLVGVDKEPIDQGIVLFFPSPRSYTGEDVLEIQGHGGPVVMDLLLRRVFDLGARPANPGEFSERAFRNGKLDLAQAEAVADLIESATENAARLARRTLQGDFSRRVRRLRESLVAVRSFLEAAIDFPDEEIDLLADSQVDSDLRALISDTETLLDSARQGRLVREGLNLVIAGPPNAGKSSLLNLLAGADVAIVTDLPGTTRDLLHQEIQIDGMPLHIIDTAGLRHARDAIEREGLRRAREQIEQADHILWVFDGHADPGNRRFDPTDLPEGVPVTLVCNKIDLTPLPPGMKDMNGWRQIALSARTGAGLELLREQLKRACGFQGAEGGLFSARRRHLDALRRSLEYLQRSVEVLGSTRAIELVAEDLRGAQRALGEITGELTPDDLLAQIFSSFCIGK